ncbi:hypothetical protein J1N35_023626 [Gossypium stocksii]|uniref:CCHC-type domain-containing protein n=1 Tax=Gossypium stocksii TaxID=47602 RepID=A0A9D3VIH5_9ROSI|nr:hypothetical protein J1N35_023626 [Gossypium stocksii]
MLKWTVLQEDSSQLFSSTWRSHSSRRSLSMEGFKGWSSESLLAVCFSCGCYGHLKDVCPSNGPALNSSTGKEQVSSLGVVKPASAGMGDPFGPWMIVERKSRQNQKENRNQKPKLLDKELSKSRFEAGWWGC